MTNQNIDPWKCERCGHQWYGRNPNVKPRRCASCTALYWDRPARVPKPYVEPACIGRAEKYGFSALDVGGSKLVPWHSYTLDQLARLSPKEEAELADSRSKIYPAAMSYARRRGWEFATFATPKGLLVKRLK